MVTEKARSFVIVLFAFQLFQLAFAVSGHCQAWVAPKGTGSISISYLNEFSNTNYFIRGNQFVIAGDGTRIDEFGELRTQGVYFDFTYSLTDKLGVSASIPFLARKYNSDSVDPFYERHKFPDGSIPLDDGDYHGAFQDFLIRVRYNVTAHPFQITPFVEYNQPSHDYLFFSHAVIGSNVRSLGLGTYVGGTLDRILPNAYIQGRYSYNFDEKIIGISRSRNIGDIEFGYFLTPSIRAFTIFAGQITRGGFNVGCQESSCVPPPSVVSNPFFFHHGQISRSNYLNIGVGSQYSFNEGVDVFAVVSHMVAARNLHGLTYGITLGMSWGFGGGPQRPCHC